MVQYLDIDTFLTRADFRLLNRLVWPWENTHFILSNKCYGCHSIIDFHTLRPFHFIIRNKNKSHTIFYSNKINIDTEPFCCSCVVHFFSSTFVTNATVVGVVLFNKRKSRLTFLLKVPLRFSLLHEFFASIFRSFYQTFRKYGGLDVLKSKPHLNATTSLIKVRE